MDEPVWSTACPDWEQRIIKGQSLIPFPPLFPAEAESALDVFRDLVVVDAPGSPTMADACRPWVFDLVSAVFGAYDAESGRRLIREFLLLVSKKNTKSTLAAGIMLTALIRNWREGAEFLILAPTVEVANNAFTPASGMVNKSEQLRDLLHIQAHTRTITHRITGASLKVVAAENDTVSGKKATGVLVDELWLFGKRPHAEGMLREATGGLASRPEGFVIWASTQSDAPPAGVFRQKLHYFRQVRDGKTEDKRSLPVLYEFPTAMVQAEAYRDKANFYITNPNLGLSVDEEFLTREYDKAVVAGEASLQGFFAKHLNVEIGLSMMSDNWAGAEYWAKRGRATITLDAILAECEVVVVGGDGGGLDDLLGLGVMGRHRVTGHWWHWAKAWAHPIVLERRKSEAPRLRDLEASGDLAVVREVGDDLAELVEIIVRIRDSGLLGGIGLDPHGIGAIVDALRAEDIGEDMLVGIPQGYTLNGAVKTAERKLADGTMWHGGQPMMAWCVGNAKVEPRGNAVLITKQASGRAKIDPLMAMLNCVQLMSRNPVPKVSPYEHRGLLTI